VGRRSASIHDVERLRISEAARSAGLGWCPRMSGAMPHALTCRDCGTVNEPSQRFCGNCGSGLALPCSNCGQDNPPGFHFCGNCGHPLPEDESSSPAAPPPTEERRWATVLFADLSGFTTLSERMDPEDVRSLVDRCMRRAGEVVSEFGGTVISVMGDGLMALFGAPMAHGDDAERAVRAALRMQQEVAAEEVDFGGLPLRVGINTGEVMFAPVGPGELRLPTAIGDVTNTAARLQSVAPRVGILVGEETYQATRHAIRFEELEPLSLKGKELPVRAWLAHEPMIGPGERPGSMMPIIGRDAELEILARIWERVVSDRRPHQITVLGPPGIGKTRLAREFSVNAEAGGANVAFGRCLPYGENTGYGAFSQQLKSIAEIFDTDSAPEARIKLGRLVDRLLPGDDNHDVASHLEILLGLEDGSSLAERDVLFLDVRRLVEALAATRPTMLVFEDIHWADTTLLDLIEYLAARTRDSPLLLFTLARQDLMDVRPGWGGGLSSYTVLRLDSLSPRDARALAARLLKQGVGNSTVLEKVQATAEGNPLFIEELSASLSETSWLAAGQLPTTVRGIVAARLDALPAQERAVLLDASVAGKNFWRGALLSLNGDDGLDHTIDSLESRDFIRREGRSEIAGDTEFTFKHMLIREVAYATLPRSVRRERHAAMARFIEGAAGDRTTESAALLAHHWREAGDAKRAVSYLVMAAENARRAWAKGEAVLLYGQALELLPGEDSERFRSIRLQRALTIVESGDFLTGAEALDELIPKLEGRDLIEALLARGKTAYWTTDANGARAHSQRAADSAERLGDAELRAPALALLSATAAMVGDIEPAVTLARQGANIWPSGARQHDRAHFWGTAGILHYWVGDYETAIDWCRRGYELGMEMRNLEGLMTCAAPLALSLASAGRFEEALEICERVSVQGRDLEQSPRFTSRMICIWGGILREAFSLDEAIPLIQEAAELADQADFPMAKVQGRIDLLFVDIAAGNLGRASDSLAGLRDDASQLKGFHQWLTAGRLAQARAEIALQTSPPEAAVEAAQEALLEAQVRRRLKYEVAARSVLGLAHLRARQSSQGIVELERAVQGAERLGSPIVTWRASGALAEGLDAVGDDDRTEAAFRAATAAIDDCAAALPENHRPAFLNAPSVQRVLDLNR
jgi:class 3 adenylate cyclase/tetratricopeptide (TPR) repeat protein